MTEALQLLATLLVLSGAFFCLVASIGIVRFEDVFMRMHAASKAGTFGAGLPLIGAALILWEMSAALRALSTVAFLLLTAPIAAHLLARAAYRRDDVELSGATVVDQLGRSNVSDPEEPAA
ncbi:MAG: monovalent cation/H(+) antiporter subunit G [Planctomycetota bacterium]